jgi:HSP20 family molecular chaperone IbpA
LSVRLIASPRPPTAIRPTTSSGFPAQTANLTACRSRQQDDKERHYLHRGIAARQFQRTFVLADGMEVLGADLKNGLLAIDLARPEPERIVKTISITDTD